MRRKRHTLDELNIENEDIQTTLRRNLGIQLTQRTRSRVSWIGKEGFPFRFLALIQRLKALLGHEYLAPNNQPFRCVMDKHRDRADGL